MEPEAGLETETENRNQRDRDRESESPIQSQSQSQSLIKSHQRATPRARDAEPEKRAAGRMRAQEPELQKDRREPLLGFRILDSPLPHSLYLNRHLIGSLQHCQNCILRAKRSFQTFSQQYGLGSKLLKGKE